MNVFKATVVEFNPSLRRHICFDQRVLATLDSGNRYQMTPSCIPMGFHFADEESTDGISIDSSSQTPVVDR